MQTGFSSAALTSLVALVLFCGCNRISGPKDSESVSHLKDSESVSHPKDLTSVSVSLARHYCYGWCPVYNLTVRGSGIVDYNGLAYVPVRGHQTTTLPPERVMSILQEVDRARFMSIDDRKFRQVADGDAMSITVSVDGRTKTIHSSGTVNPAAPEEYLRKYPYARVEIDFQKLAQKIDTLSESYRWTKCSPKCTSLVIMLASRKPDGSAILLQAIQSKKEVRPGSMSFDAHTMIEAGVDVNAPNQQGITPLMAAAKNGDADLIRDLLAHGAISKAKDKKGRTALDYARSPEVRNLLSPGAPGK